MQLYHLAIALAALAIVLVAIAVAIIGSLRRSRRRVAEKFVETAAAKYQAEVEEIEPKILRVRHLRSISEGGGDPSPTEAFTAASFYGEVESRLEQAFTQFQRSRISLESFEAIILVEQETAMRRVARIKAQRASGAVAEDAFESELNDAEDAASTASWCLNWVAEMKKTPRTDDPAEETPLA